MVTYLQMEDISLEQFEARFGTSFVRALRHTVGLRASGDESAKVWRAGEAKNRLDVLLDRILDGEAQLVRRRPEDSVLMLSVTQLATLVERVVSKRRFADAIEHNPGLPVGAPLTVSEMAIGRDATAAGLVYRGATADRIAANLATNQRSRNNVGRSEDKITRDAIAEIARSRRERRQDEA